MRFVLLLRPLAAVGLTKINGTRATGRKWTFLNWTRTAFVEKMEM